MPIVKAGRFGAHFDNAAAWRWLKAVTLHQIAESSLRVLRGDAETVYSRSTRLRCGTESTSMDQSIPMAGGIRTGVVLSRCAVRALAFTLIELLVVIAIIAILDQHTTLAPRGRGTVPCERCGKPASGLSLPREAKLKAWNSVRKTKAEVAPSPAIIMSHRTQKA
jgi:prepilin-type N-terminal cleavage/methylation domain-containing protein